MSDADIRRRALEDAIAAIMGEHLHEPITSEDAAYDRAVDDCEAAIHALINCDGETGPRPISGVVAPIVARAIEEVG